MCGITGFIGIGNPNYNTNNIINSMTDSILHRGPDNGGGLLDNDVNGRYIAFGHRRLTIIDLSDMGRQPMTNDDKSIWLTFNGEIYNYLELKEELKGKGHTFKSTSDTEVVIAAYEEWGTNCFSRFNGMWAMAIYDRHQRKLILSRDRFGKKPLYYYKTDNELIFASEIKAFQMHPNVTLAPNYEKIFRYISTNYRYVDIDNESYFADIYQVQKGCFIEIGFDLNVTNRHYWQLEIGSSLEGISDLEAVDRFRDLFIDSIRLRLRSDVPVGCMLSGGLDSTSITCVAYKILQTPIRTFSGITGDVKGVYDESDYIEAIVKATEAEHLYLRTDPAELFATTNEILAYHDEPLCTVTWYSLYLIAKKIKEQNITVVLNGHGGDELLAGYWDHYHYNLYDLQIDGDSSTFEYETKCWMENHRRDTSELLRTREYIERLSRGQISEMSRFLNYADCFSEEIRSSYTREINLSYPQKATYLSRRLYLEMLFETIPASLRPEDRNTMANSIESRSPLLDYRLAELCFSLPNRFKIRDGVGKWVLREAMKGILPEDIRTRKDKAGFIAPADEWFRTINRTQIEEMINSDLFKSRGIFNVKRVNEVFCEHLRGEKNHQMFLWQLINLELWFRRFFD